MINPQLTAPVDITVTVNKIDYGRSEIARTAFTLATITLGMSSNFSQDIPIAGLSQGVTNTMTLAQKQAQMMGNLTTLVRPAIEEFAQDVRDAISMREEQILVGFPTTETVTFMALGVSLIGLSEHVTVF